MRILITGGAGFLGSTIGAALIEQGHTVIAIDDLSTGRSENFNRLWIGDIRKPTDIAQVVERLGGVPAVIYHCAASYKDRGDWERDASTNVLGTINVVREAQRTGAKLIYFQTSLCYGPNPVSPVSLDAPLDPRGSYATSKTAGEMYIRDSGVPFVSLRLANIYGPRNLSGPIPAFYQRLSKGEPCTVVDSRRDFVFVDDLVEVAVKAATQGRGVYHVSSGRDAAVKDIYWDVAEAMKVEAPEPTYVARQPDDVATILLNPTETQQEFGWAAKTPLVSGIRQAVDWYKANLTGDHELFTHLTPPAALRT